jgi:hypothetical protein
MKTASAVPKTLEITQKTRYQIDFGVGPIEYICVVHGQVFKIKSYVQQTKLHSDNQ